VTVMGNIVTVNCHIVNILCKLNVRIGKLTVTKMTDLGELVSVDGQLIFKITTELFSKKGEKEK